MHWAQQIRAYHFPCKPVPGFFSSRSFVFTVLLPGCLAQTHEVLQKTHFTFFCSSSENIWKQPFPQCLCAQGNCIFTWLLLFSRDKSKKNPVWDTFSEVFAKSYCYVLANLKIYCLDSKVNFLANYCSEGVGQLSATVNNDNNIEFFHGWNSQEKGKGNWKNLGWASSWVEVCCEISVKPPNGCGSLSALWMGKRDQTPSTITSLKKTNAILFYSDSPDQYCFYSLD